MTPPLFDILDFQNWEVKMSMYLKAFGIHIFLATTKDLYYLNGKHFKANTKTIHALKSTLNDDYLSRVSNFVSAFLIWNTLVSFGEQMPHHKKSDSDDGSITFNMCYMV